MLSYYKTVDGRIRMIPEAEPGCWINCIAPSDEEINGMIEDYLIEPEFFRSAMDEEESSHIDHEDDSTLVIIDVPIVEKDKTGITYSTMPLSIILTEKNVITVSIRNNPVVEEFAQGLVKGVQTNLKTRFILSIMLRVASRYLQYLKQIDKISNFIEDELRETMKNSELLQLFDIEKSLVYFSSSLKGNEITLEKIMRGRIIKLYDEDQDLLEDVLIEVRQAIDMSGIYLSILSGTMEAFASVNSNSLNIGIKTLVSIALLVLVPAVVIGLYGMNVSGLPLANFWFPAGFSVLYAAVVAVVLRRKKML